MRKNRWWSMAVALLVSVAVLAGCGTKKPTEPAQPAPSAPAPAPEVKPTEVTVKIGIIGARSGPAAELGTYLDGAVAAFRHLNDQGGVKSKDGKSIYKFETLVRDDEANPAKGKELTEELILKEKVLAIIGPTNTANAIQMLPVVFENKTPLISGVATGTVAMQAAQKAAADSNGPNWFFRTTTPDVAQAEKLASYLKVKNFQKIAIMHDATAYGKGGLVELQAQLKAMGIDNRVVTVQEFAFTDTDLTPQVQRVKEAGADVIVGWALGHQHALIAGARAKLGVSVPQLGSTAIGQVIVRQLAGPAAEGLIGIWPRDHAFAPEGGKIPDRITQSYDVYKKYFPNGHPLEQYGPAVFPWDAAMIIANAVAEVGTDKAKLRDAIETLPHTNVASKPLIQFSKEQHEVWAGKDFAMVVIKGGLIHQTND